uniref:DIS3-like exonuclease 2 n=1 Tax=Timema poppense TaxID=170557 RepID=A0A7R9CNW5_TIMPO|nr:unnamed protein product [Timema poppensis]
MYENTKTATINVNRIVLRMIEEFMLLANVTVATWLKERFPDIAFLRCHPSPLSSPLPHMMKEMKETLEHVGIHLDVSSAGSLQASLGRYSGDDPYSQARLIVLNTLCARPMAVSKLTTAREMSNSIVFHNVSLLQRAKYFCASFASEAPDFWHYALSVPLYTHYTSPIRRYADVMVHRLLAASLGYSDKPQWHDDFVQKIASNCNKQKFAAKRAGEQSTELYLAIYVGLHGPMVEEAVVVDVKDHSFDIIVCSMGCTQRIYTNKIEAKPTFQSQGKISSLVLQWPSTETEPNSVKQIIQIFSIVTVSLRRSESSLKIETQLLRPRE